MSTTTAAAAEPAPGILSEVVSSIWTPGTNSGLIKAMNYSFYALFVTLFGMVLLTGGNIHVCALLTLSIGLFASIKWYVQFTATHSNRVLSADSIRPLLSLTPPSFVFYRFLVQIADVEEERRKEALLKDKNGQDNGIPPSAEVASSLSGKGKTE